MDFVIPCPNRPTMDREVALELLQVELNAARKRVALASETFDAVIREVPTGIPYPDKVQRIRNASRDYSDARDSVAIAVKRMNELVLNGIIPDDLKGRSSRR
jgi:hypothetical protein